MNPPSRAGGSNKFILRPVYSPLTPSLWTRAVAVAVAAASSSSSTTFLGEFSIESRKNRDEAKVPSSRGDDVLVFALACAASCVYVIAPPPPPPPPPPSPFRRSSSSEDPLAPPASTSGSTSCACRSSGCSRATGKCPRPTFETRNLVHAEAAPHPTSTSRRGSRTEKLHSAHLRQTAQQAARQKLRLNKAGAIPTPDKTCANFLYRLTRDSVELPPKKACA